ncbi:MAG: NAD-dependent epimerase/dehydratase family protein [Bacteroidota bacterium]
MDEQQRPSNKKILVTGGTGFLGSYLLRYLLQNGDCTIRAIYRDYEKVNLLFPDIKEQIEWIECDILDTVGMEDALTGIDLVYHSAALISFQRKDRKKMLEVNVQGTANIVDLALHTGVKKMLYVSSIAALGRTKPGQLIHEKNQWERSPYNTNYGLSKYLGEQEAWRGFAEGLEVVVVNPAMILGSQDWDKGLARFFKMIHEGFSFYPVGGNGLVDVRDVVEMMVLLMDSNINGERYIASSETLKYQDFFTLIASALSVKAPSRKISPFVQSILWRLSWFQSALSGQPAFITKENATQASHIYYYQNDKSKSLPGFSYRSLKATIQAVAKDYQSFLEQGGQQWLKF